MSADEGEDARASQSRALLATTSEDVDDVADERAELAERLVGEVQRVGPHVRD